MNANTFIHRAVKGFNTAMNTHPLTVTAATVGTTTLCGLGLYTVLEYLEPIDSAKSIVYDGGDDNNGVDSSNDLYLGHPRGTTEHYRKNATATMTVERARLQAMIENAQQSTWQENIDNATMAQERFMLPGRPHHDKNGEPPAFMKKIEARSQEIMQQHEKRMELERQKEKRRKLTTKMW